MNFVQLAILEMSLNYLVWKKSHIRYVHWVVSGTSLWPERQKIIIRFMSYKLHIWLSIEDRSRQIFKTR